MKFKLLSDLHLEFYDVYRGGLPQQPVWEPKETPEDKNTVLLLAGDIHVGTKAEKWIDRMADRFHDVIYILGNHEFYNQEYYKTIDFWKSKFNGGNFTFLQDDYFIDYDAGYRIFGATLWTEVTDPFNIWNGRKMMTDYHVIKLNVNKTGYYRKLSVNDTNEFHLYTLDKLKKFLATPWEGKTIVMTHHLPHPLCVHDKWKASDLNDFFMTNLDNIIADNKIDVWVHGHTHDNVDINVHDTYFVVAHFHLVMGISALYGMFAGIYHWYPRLFGRMLNKNLGYIHFWITAICAYGVFFPMHFIGMAGLPRRYYTNSNFPLFDDLSNVNVVITIFALIGGAFQLVFLWNFFYSMFYGKKAKQNPWKSNTLEWTAPVEHMHGNWPGAIPHVHRWAYDYSKPGHDEDFVPQNTPLKEGEEELHH